MSKFKEFTGKTLDEAIENALTSFGVPREKLELEIVSGGSSGIFGLMSRKAVVKARLRIRLHEQRQAEEAADAAPELAAPATVQAPATPAAKPAPQVQAAPPARPAGQAPQRNERPAQAGNNGDRSAKPQAPHRDERQPQRDQRAQQPQAAETQAQASPARPQRPATERPAPGPKQGGNRPGRSRGEGSQRRDERPQRPERPERAPQFDNFDYDEDDILDRPTRAPRVAPEDEPDTQTLNAVVLEVVQNILTPIIGPTKLEISNEPGRVKVLILDEENSGLIIGREGQTITSLQYIVNRIVARKLLTSARVHLDAGDYRQRQDDNLQRMALYLADKAKNQNRTQSTKPLSSYHRRLVHMALQDDDSIITSSKGEGPLKRVLIHPRKGGGAQRQA